MKDWNESTSFTFNGPLYISLDLDALDPAFVPGVSHYEPGGFSTRQVLSIIQNLRADVVGADIVELNPTRDINNVTAMVAAKFLKEILLRMI
jgi:arginase